jgi:uncharacterized transporter YbjL
MVHQEIQFQKVRSIQWIGGILAGASFAIWIYRSEVSQNNRFLPIFAGIMIGYVVGMWFIPMVFSGEAWRYRA